MRTTLRMLAAMVAALVFTLLYGTLAAKSRRAEKLLVPVLDILQSVPVLGYISFTVTFFLLLFPGRVLGAEFAAIFAIFTSQAWNMTFSFYQSLRMLPHDLVEVSTNLRLSGWQKFWKLDVPFAMPGLVWNMMMSMSGGWFLWSPPKPLPSATRPSPCRAWVLTWPWPLPRKTCTPWVT